jgi:osmotically-inducible protein OsmY
MNKGVALVGGVVLGAVLMYFFDPDRGKRRRELCRDKVEEAGNKVGGYADKVSRDVRNRASEIVADTKSLFAHEDLTDEDLVDRVRSKLGHHPIDSDAVDIQATKGAVILSGSVTASESLKLLKAARRVRGVSRVENQLRVLPDKANAPDLQASPQPVGA